MPEDKGKGVDRAPKRPRKSRKSKDSEPAAHVACLTDLPSEVLSLIAAYLLPPTYVAQYGIASPYERPYPGPLKITPGLAPAGERFGSVPRAVMDVVNFARVCRLTMGAAGRAMASFGGSTPSPSSKSTGDTGPSGSTSATAAPDAGEPPIPAVSFKQCYDDVPKRTLYVQIDHLDDPKGEKIRSFILAHRSTLEELVFYKCPQFHFNRHFEKVLNSMQPFQVDNDDKEGVLPKLRRVQIGPKMCSACSRAALSLLCAKKFSCRTFTTDNASLETTIYDTAVRSYGGWRVIDLPNVAAPNLTHLEIHTSVDQHREVREMPTIMDMINRIVADLRQQIEVLTVWLRPLEMQWGGFRQQGTSSAVRGKSIVQVETELDEALFGKKWTPAALEQRQAVVKAKEADRLAKYKIFAKSAIPKPPKRSKENTPADKNVTDSGEDKKPSHNGSVPPETLAGQAAPTNGHLVSLADHLLDPVLTNGASSHLKVEEISRPSSPPFSFNSHPPRNDDEESESGKRSVSVETNPATPTTNYVPRKGGAQSYAAMSTGVREILQFIAGELPNLAALRVLRSGTALIDAVEDFRDPEEYAAWLVAPLGGLSKLQYLDLGLAVIGKREVGDFPLGVSLLDKTPATIKSRTPQMQQTVALKAKKWKANAESAIREGDAWRKTVIERFVLGQEQRPPSSEAANGDGSPIMDQPPSPAASDISGSSTPPPTSADKWPATLMSGFVYTVDLENRAKRRGLVVPWTRKVTVDNGERSEEIVWGEKQPVML